MIRSLSAGLLWLSQGAPSEPAVLVKIVQPKPKTLADIVFGAVGLTGVLVAVAVVFALGLAGVLFLARSRNPLKNASDAAEHG